MSTAADLSIEQEGMRQRQPGDASTQKPPSDAAVNEQHPARAEEDPKSKKTYGRTPDGTVFTVPTTHDMVSQLLDPRQPKNASDLVVLASLAGHIALAYLLPASLKQLILAVVFIFWRASYNVGIGYLLRIQSNHNTLVNWAKKWKLFEDPAVSENPRPWLYRLLKREMETKIPQDYEFEKAPIEYNTWLVFRRVVDLILMCDFLSYGLFAIVCCHRPAGEGLVMTITRWSFGLALLGFNLWVKVDAHRVVKDYAWYWGDFFYLIDADLTFDGVFEMAPHPMYSIGYAGYYGVSAMSASYEVLFVSIVAHLAQFAFLATVENPHIEKTYNPPAPRRRTESGTNDRLRSDSSASSSADRQPESFAQGQRDLHKLLGLKNVDLMRTIDTSVLLILGYLLVITVATPRTPMYQALFFVHALAWRVWYSAGIGIILSRQSSEKLWTRHFLKYGQTADDAFHEWKGMYHLSMSMCHAAFVAACWKMYTVPGDWTYGWALLKHVVGAGLISLQLWTAVSIYESLGEFGWFFGDFFYDHGAKLTYKSIYRFLNNPERIMGTAGVWGAALITWSRSVFILAIVSQMLTFGFIEYVEKPHMQKIYGSKVREEAGLTKFIRRSLPAPVKQWQTGVDRVVDETIHFVEEFLEAARPRFAAGYSTFVRDTSALFNSPSRLTITRLSADMSGFDTKHYALSVEGTPVAHSAFNERSTGKEGPTGRTPKNIRTMTLQYGTPIHVKWTAPAGHGKRDWVGLYMVTDNRSRDVTEVPSLGRWVAATPGQFDSSIADIGILASDKPVLKKAGSDVELVEGEMVFEGDKLWWTQGVFEFRYHHDGKHNAMAISQPFEIRIGRFDDEDVSVDSKGVYEREVENALLPVVQHCLDHDPDIAPSTPEEPFGSHVERDSKYAKRVVYAIHHMFGIEFTAAVVPADGNVRKLAWRICNAKEVLAPYSMSGSRTVTTPVEEKFPDEVKG